MNDNFDVDWVVIGSGVGGCVAALRLARDSGAALPNGKPRARRSGAVI